jgi:hypothetical protein
MARESFRVPHNKPMAREFFACRMTRSDGYIIRLTGNVDFEIRII